MTEIEAINILRVDQIAAAINVKPDTIYKWCQRGLLPHYKLEKCVRVRLRDVMAFLDERKVTTPRPRKPRPK